MSGHSESMNPGLGHLRGMDIYVLDQAMRGRLGDGTRILDVGCGGGRNLRYFLGAGFDVCAADIDEQRVHRVRDLSRELGRDLPEENFRVEAAEDLSFEPGCFDFVICNALLHFARDHDHFTRMLHGCWKTVSPGGILFVRTASLLGLPSGRNCTVGRHLQPDGDGRYLVDEAYLRNCEQELGAERIDPLKTTVVHGKRAMTTWVLSRS